MSDTEHEQTEPTEPTEPTGPVVDDDPDQTEGTEDEAPAPEPEPEQKPENETQLDAVYVKLERRAANYVKSISEILDGHDVPVHICEMCADAFPGVRWVQPADEAHAAMIAVSGSDADGSPLEDDPDAIICDRCKGWGWTKLPARVPGNEQRLCRQCNGAGWLDTNPQSGARQAPTPAPDNGTAEVLPGVPEDDPSVVDLRARGFTVIPPMQIGAAAEQGA